jgi:hypothetical protein
MRASKVAPASQEACNIIPLVNSRFGISKTLMKVRAFGICQDLGQKRVQWTACLVFVPFRDQRSNARNITEVSADAQWQWKRTWWHNQGTSWVVLQLEAQRCHRFGKRSLAGSGTKNCGYLSKP